MNRTKLELHLTDLTATILVINNKQTKKKRNIAEAIANYRIYFEVTELIFEIWEG